MVIEMGMSPAIAAQKLKPWVKNFTRSSESAKKIGYGMGFSGVLVGILIGATSGIGLMALAPVAAGAWCINDGLTSTKEHSAREAEYLMLLECPEFVKLIFALSQSGLSAEVLVEAYDDLVRAYGDSVQEGKDIDKYAIVSHFQELINEKSHLAGVTAAMVNEINVKAFDGLYDRESDAPLAGQGSKSQSWNVDAIEPEFDDFSDGVNALPISGKRPTVEEAIAALSLPDLTVGEFIDGTQRDRDVEGAVQSARSQPTAQSPDSSQWAKPSAIAINPISVIGNTLSSLLLIAPTGAGKGILVSNLIRHFHKSYTGLKVFAFEGKNDQNETGYWSEGFEQVARVNLDICDAIEAARAISWVVSQVNQSHGYGSPSILLVDEANTLITVLENGAKYGLREDKEECGIALGLIKKKISTAASTGNSAQKYVWVIGQNPNLTALGLNGGDSNQLRKVAIALYSNPVLTDQITLNTGYTGKKQDASYRSVIDDLIECSPVDRAFYDSASAQTTKNKGWFSMDEMINYSGYDRDSRKHIGSPPQPNTVSADPWQPEEMAESNESYTMPEDPSDRVKLAAKLVQESGTASPSEIDELVPGLSRYLPTVVLFYSECTRKGEVYTWAS